MMLAKLLVVTLDPVMEMLSALTLDTVTEAT